MTQIDKDFFRCIRALISPNVPDGFYNSKFVQEDDDAYFGLFDRNGIFILKMREIERQGELAVKISIFPGEQLVQEEIEGYNVLELLGNVLFYLKRSNFTRYTEEHYKFSK